MKLCEAADKHSEGKLNVSVTVRWESWEDKSLKETEKASVTMVGGGRMKRGGGGSWDISNMKISHYRMRKILIKILKNQFSGSVFGYCEKALFCHFGKDFKLFFLSFFSIGSKD